ncbi:hypothetical protein [Streptomyces sp. AF1A]|jgi:hypothetical protein|uniref:hypothetical protein n=1 Tax=Streptomyces sp. AF1A TaxID=3394350 RepID=UPI0039BD8272
MCSLRLTLCSGILAVTAFGPAAPAAHVARAADAGSLSVAPAAPAPGSDVTLRVSGCTGKQGTAVSRAFVSDARLTGAQGTLAGDTRVGSAVRPGSYEVKVSCADRVIDGVITVGGRASATGADQGSGRPAQPGRAAASPVAPVAAGGGGTAHFATVATTGSGPGTAQAVTGLALASVAALALGLRARRNRGSR